MACLASECAATSRASSSSCRPTRGSLNWSSLQGRSHDRVTSPFPKRRYKAAGAGVGRRRGSEGAGKGGTGRGPESGYTVSRRAPAGLADGGPSVSGGDPRLPALRRLGHSGPRLRGPLRGSGLVGVGAGGDRVVAVLGDEECDVPSGSEMKLSDTGP